MEAVAPRWVELWECGSPLLHARLCRTTGTRAGRADTNASYGYTSAGPSPGEQADSLHSTWGVRAALLAMRVGRCTCRATPRVKSRNDFMRLHEDVDMIILLHEAWPSGNLGGNEKPDTRRVARCTINHRSGNKAHSGTHAQHGSGDRNTPGWDRLTAVGACRAFFRPYAEQERKNYSDGPHVGPTSMDGD